MFISQLPYARTCSYEMRGRAGDAGEEVFARVHLRLRAKSFLCSSGGAYRAHRLVMERLGGAYRARRLGVERIAPGCVLCRL